MAQPAAAEKSGCPALPTDSAEIAFAHFRFPVCVAAPHVHETRGAFSLSSVPAFSPGHAPTHSMKTISRSHCRCGAACSSLGHSLARKR